MATTAGGTVTIRFLEREVAEEIAQSLHSKVRYILKQQGISVDDMPPQELKSAAVKGADHD